MRPTPSCLDGACGGCPRCGCPDPEPSVAELEDLAAQQIDAEEDAACA
jgi:hypothetical protein